MSNKANVDNRQAGPDVVRSVACLLVVALHFYLNCGYYNEPLVGHRMFIMTCCRWLFVAAVPLFFMLTGYFMQNKVVSVQYYRGIIPLAVSYIVISAGKMILYNRLYGKVYPFGEMLKNIGNYQIAWYMGMYLCLYLLIPFLNRMWKALDDKEKNILIATMIFLCGIYPIFKYVAPMFFVGIYPVMYYFIGTAIRERQYRINRWLLLGIAVVVSVIEAVISFTFTSVEVFDWNVISTADGTYGTLLMCITGVCIFLAFYQVDVRSKLLKRLFAAISSVSFEIYLFAGAYDAVIYLYLKRSVNGANEFFWWFFVTVPASFTAAFISAVVYKHVVMAIGKLLGKISIKR